VILNPSFPEEELERVRKQLTARLLLEKDQPNAVASRATARVLYGETHPYAHLELGSQVFLERATRADVEGFYRKAWQPDGATLIVAGDTTLDEAARMVEKALGSWQKVDRLRADLPEAAPASNRTVYLVNKPGAAQSTLVLAQIGIPRSTADYFEALVLNAAFGSMFSSRLNLNLREAKGYTYGARSSWSFRRGAGPFTAIAPVQTKVTKEALAEMIREIEEVRDSRPIDAEELEFAKSNLVRSFPQRFETPEQIAERYREVVLYGLPPDFFNHWVEKVRAVTLADVARVAKERFRPEALSIVVVGDAEVIRKGIEELKLGKLVELDPWGAPVTVANR
jgi:zinc protease